MCLVSGRHELLGADSCEDNNRNPYSAESVVLRTLCPFIAGIAKITTAGARHGLLVDLWPLHKEERE